MKYLSLVLLYFFAGTLFSQGLFKISATSDENITNSMLSSTQSGQKIPINIEINNLRNSNGSIIVSIFKDQKGFDNEIPYVKKSVAKSSNMKNGVFRTQFSLPTDSYGIAIVDDEYDSGEMNYNFIGMPKEGFGFSNFYLTVLTKPKFSDFSFNLSEQTGTIKIRVKYL